MSSFGFDTQINLRSYLTLGERQTQRIARVVPSSVNRNLSGEKPNLCRVRAQLSPLSSVFWHYEWSEVPGGKFLITTLSVGAPVGIQQFDGKLTKDRL